MSVNTTNETWWRGEWLRFLESERSGGRATLAALLALLITMFGLFISVLTTRNLSPASDIFWLLMTIAVWALTTTSVTAYAWAQYLGAVRSFSRRYLTPKPKPDRDIRNEAVQQANFRELEIRDPGILLRIVLTSSGKRDYLAEVADDSVKHSAVLARILFISALVLSAVAIVSLLGSMAGFIPTLAVAWLFFTALVVVLLAGLALVPLTRALSRYFLPKTGPVVGK